MAVHTKNDVAGDQAGLRRRAILFHRAHERAARAIEPERLCELRVDVLDRHADAAPHDVARLHELVFDVPGNIDRNGERHAHVAAGAAEDLRVDADHLTRHVEERAAGIARVHRHVRLDEGDVVVARERARSGADDARGRAVFETEGRADREHPLTRLDPRRIPEPHGGQIGRVDLDHRHVGTLVGPDDFRRELAPVGEAHRDLIGVGHDVGVGEDVTVTADDEAGARAAYRRLVSARRLLIRARDTEAAEEVEKRVVGRQARHTTVGLLRLLDNLHVDDGGAVLFDEG